MSVEKKVETFSSYVAYVERNKECECGGKWFITSDSPIVRCNKCGKKDGLVTDDNQGG